MHDPFKAAKKPRWTNSKRIDRNLTNFPILTTMLMLAYASYLYDHITVGTGLSQLGWVLFGTPCFFQWSSDSNLTNMALFSALEVSPSFIPTFFLITRFCKIHTLNTASQQICGWKIYWTLHDSTQKFHLSVPAHLQSTDSTQTHSPN